MSKLRRGLIDFEVQRIRVERQVEIKELGRGYNTSNSSIANRLRF